MSKKRSLADELADLINPAPRTEYDPEAFEHDAPVLNDSDDEAVPAPKPAHKAAKEKGLLMRGDLVLEDAAYKGRKTSRAEMFGDEEANGHAQFLDSGTSDDGSDVEEEQSNDDDDEMEGEEASDAEEELDQDEDELASEQQASEQDEEEREGRHTAAAKKQALTSDDIDGLDEEPSEDGEDLDDGARLQHKLLRPAQEAQLAALDQEYGQLAMEEQQGILTMQARKDKETAKGLAVKNQQVLYEKALEMRILLQKGMQGAHVMPRQETYGLLISQNEAVKAKYQALQSELTKTLDVLASLHAALVARNPEVPQANGHGLNASNIANGEADNAQHKRKRPMENDEHEHSTRGSEVMWQRLQKEYNVFAPFRDEALDRWHRRTVLSSGAGALRNNLRALNQSISHQVAAIVKDPVKFVKRSRLTVSLCPHILCEPSKPKSQDTNSQQGGSEAAVSFEEEERDPETFDDSEFYQQLLKEFLDKGAAGAAVAAPKAQKKRKQVDRRASKGRKIRYNVQEKLVGFMAPVHQEPPPFAAQLFSNLFGHSGV